MQLGATEIYQLAEEYDGRKVLTIKPSIEYKVAFAGIIKNARPEMSDLDRIIEQEHPTENGIWVSKQSRDEFLKLIQSQAKLQYEISENGYLKIKEASKNANEIDKRIQKIMESGNQYIIDMAGSCYILDNMTGNIEQYPFEKMDAYQTYEYFKDENRMIIVISSNKDKKLNEKEILESVLELVEQM